MTNFRLADVLGVDQDTGERCCHGRISYKKAEKFFGDDSVFSKKELDSIAGSLKGTEGIYLTDFNVQVLAEDVAYSPIGEEVHSPKLTYHPYGKGCGIYLSHFTYSVENSRFLLELLLKAAGKEEAKAQLGDNIYCEAAYFPCSGKAVAVNNSDRPQHLKITLGGAVKEVDLEPCGSCMIEI